MIAFLLMYSLSASSDTVRYVAQLSELGLNSAPAPEFIDEETKVNYELELRANLDREPMDMSRHLKLANFLSDVKYDTKGADLVYQAALKVDPLNVRVRSSFAKFLLTRHGDVVKAGKQYRSALNHAQEYDPDAIPYVGGLYSVYLAQYDSVEAAEDLILRLHTASAEPLVKLANYVNKNSRDVPKPDALYRRALDVDGSDISALLNYAEFIEKKVGDYDKVEGVLVRALEIERTTETLSAYAQFLRRIRKDYSKYVVLAKEGYAKYPDEPEWAEMKIWEEAEGPLSNCLVSSVSTDTARFLACIFVKLRAGYQRGSLVTSLFGVVLGRSSGVDS